MSVEGRIGFYKISPAGDLAATAKLVGQALRIDLQHDETGRFEEVPAYVGTMNGWNLALLGVRASEVEPTEYSTADFELQLQVVSERPGYDAPQKIDEHIIGALAATGVIASLNGWGT
jgi:hypothetical protein